MKKTEQDWKLKLRYGQLKTDFIHFSLIGAGEIIEINQETKEPIGPAMIGLKCWAKSYDEGMDMLCSIGEKYGFKITGKIQVYDTEPDCPPEENPHSYGLNFTPYEK